MLGTYAIARRLTDGGLPSNQVDAITESLREAAEHGDHVTPEGLRARAAKLSADERAAQARRAANARWGKEAT